MKVFLSWSGERSRDMAAALDEWLPMVLQSIRPWRSSTGVEPGAPWSSEISRVLHESRVGIICLTPENLQAPWVLWEAGALSNSSALVVPYLLGVQPEELDGPLVQFQVATATYRDTRKLVETLNRALGDQGLSSDLLDRVFERMWPMLAHDLERISGNSGAASHQRSEGTSMAVPTIARRLASLSNTDHQLLASIVKAISGAPAAVPEAAPQDSSRDTVFVVHGHDHGTMEKTARFIERLGAEAIVLHERPNEGRTVIEKFELHSNTKYAVVLLTADDTGGTKNGSREQQLPRARQNVILELGYFLAKLGRNRVCVLLEEGVEQPSDVAGVIYISLDRHDAWKWLLARELKTAGIGVDLNKAL